MNQQLVELVEGAAKARKEIPVQRQYIEEALRRIDAGEEVERYPTDQPSLKAVYNLAVRIEEDLAVKN